MLQPGQKSEELGYEDVDGIVERVATDSESVTRTTGYKLYGDGERLIVNGRDKDGRLVVENRYSSIFDHAIFTKVGLQAVA